MSAALQRVADAKLPTTYERAKVALEKCEKLDECRDWKNKAAALASYAKQAEDDSLYQTSMRIKGRAVRRMGELLKEIEPKVGGDRGGGRPAAGAKPTSGRPVDGLTRTSAAEAAGISRHQAAQAIQIASIPKRQFEKAIESQEPPTLTALANEGKRPRPKPAPSTSHLKGRDPEDYNAALHARSTMRRMADMCGEVTPALIVRGTVDYDYADMKRWAKTILRWTEDVHTRLEKKT